MAKEKSDYQKKLEDPRWQLKKAAILIRDKGVCQLCGSNENSIHVHHKYYLYNVDPWDYPDSALVTICFECHAEQTELSKGLKATFNTFSCKFENGHLWDITKALDDNTDSLKYPNNELANALIYWLQHPDKFIKFKRK